VTVTLVCPADPIVIVPPHEHVDVDESSRAAWPSIMTSVAPGVQSLSRGWQGWGVSVPMAADVAAATCGFDSDVHIPNDGRLLVSKSDTVPAAACVPLTSWLDAVNVAGVVPNEH
jgi:hypothetical protein